jgi:DNA-binding MarR family transcriptional regulator
MQILITQTAQSAVCNRHHVVEQQLCRFLLQRLDNLPTNELMITQEQIARLLGVRRESVTQAAAKLHEAGYVRYSRGRITVLNHQALEQLSCECYAVVKQEFDRFLPQPCVAQQQPMPVVQQRTRCCSPAREFPERVSAV